MREMLLTCGMMLVLALTSVDFPTLEEGLDALLGGIMT
jgi:hypothetical protein